MKTLLIDPAARTITEQVLDERRYFKQMQEIIGGNLDHIPLQGHFDLDVWVHDEGLMNIEYGPMSRDDAEARTKLAEGIYTPQCVSQFFVLHLGGQPLNLVNGKAIVTGFAGAETVGVPEAVTPEDFMQLVRFVPDGNRNRAAELCGDILDLCGVVESMVELEAVRAKQTAILQCAIEIATLEP